MRAAKDKSISIAKSIRERLVEINARDLLGDGMLDPSLFDKRNQ